MIPLVATQRELLYLRESLEEEIGLTFKGTGQLEKIPIGTMIETPRAAITAERLGIYADFFSFGTNDLTQLTWAFSRDDVESSFLPRYLDLELLPFNPFESLDQAGVGILVKNANDQILNLVYVVSMVVIQQVFISSIKLVWITSRALRLESQLPDWNLAVQLR